MAEKRVIEYEAASELANDDWLLIDGVTEGTRKARPNVVTAELGAQVTNIATAVSGLTQVAMGHEQSFAPDYDESASYDVGDLVMQYHGLYRCTAATTGAWDAGKWARTEVSEQLEESGKIDDVQVNGVSVVTDKVASIDLTDMQADIDSKQADTKIGGASILDNNKVANLDFLASYGEASGSIASFNDGAAMPLKSLKIGIEPVQSGSGDPSPENIRPITGWTAVNVVDSGKNFLIHPLAYVGAPYNADVGTKINLNVRSVQPTYVDGTLTVQASAWGGINFRTAPLKQGVYTIKFDVREMTSPRLSVYVCDRDNLVVNKYSATSSSVYERTYTVEDGNYIILAVATSTEGTIVVSNIQVEYGSTTTDYEPYNGTTYTTTLKDGQGNPLTCYGGELSNENGVQSLEKTFDDRDLSTLQTWTFIGTYGTATNVFRAYYPLKDCASSQVYNALCESYKMVSRDVLRSGADLTIALYKAPNEEYGTIFINDTNYNDVTAFVASINGVHIAYETPTPTTIPQDNLAISTQDGTNNLWADSGDVLECKYVRDNSAVINDLIARVTALENA